MMALSPRQSLKDLSVLLVQGDKIRHGVASLRVLRISSLPQMPYGPFAMEALDTSCTETSLPVPASDNGSTNRDPLIDADNSRHVEASPPDP